MSYLAWFAALLSIFGLYLLSGCVEENCMHSSTGVGDAIAFLGAICW